MKNRLSIFILSGFVVLAGLTSCKNILTGYYSKEAFLQKCEWKKQVDQKYVDKKAKKPYLDSLKTLRDSVDVKMFLGTWCSDSKKQVPRFFALQPYMPIRKVDVIAVDTTKKDSLAMYKDLKVDSVPTLLFYRNEKQVARFNVKPPKKKRLEQQLYLILKQAEGK